MLLAAGRRLLFILALASGVTLAIASLLALALDASLSRAISLGFYAVGCFLLLAGFFVGTRGPARLKDDTEGGMALPFVFFGPRRVRWATAEESERAINDSAIFVTLGFLLILIAVAVDSRHELI